MVHHAFLQDEQIEQCHRKLELGTLPEACKRLLISDEFVQARKAFSGSPSSTMQVQWVEVLENMMSVSMMKAFAFDSAGMELPAKA